MNKLQKATRLYNAWQKGKLGGDIMPEDNNPNLPLDSEENLLYFTLPMALNYQRNSYKLWESAKTTYLDLDAKDVFNVEKVLNMPQEKLQELLTKHKIALQQNKQPEIWKRLCETIMTKLDGKLINLFQICDYDIILIKQYIQKDHKKDFPYLSGEKICNYWLYVLIQYTNLKLKNKSAITIAPDTHIMQASKKLGLISETENNNQQACALAWEELLKDSELCPIDMHTPLWLWSRGGFKDFG